MSSDGRRGTAAFALWCEVNDWDADDDAPHGQAFFAGYEAGLGALPVAPVGAQEARRDDLIAFVDAASRLVGLVLGLTGTPGSWDVGAALDACDDVNKRVPHVRRALAQSGVDEPRPGADTGARCIAHAAVEVRDGDCAICDLEAVEEQLERLRRAIPIVTDGRFDADSALEHLDMHLEARHSSRGGGTT